MLEEDIQVNGGLGITFKPYEVSHDYMQSIFSDAGENLLVEFNILPAVRTVVHGVIHRLLPEAPGVIDSKRHISLITKHFKLEYDSSYYRAPIEKQKTPETKQLH